MRKKIIIIIIAAIIAVTTAICIAIQTELVNSLQHNVKLAMECLCNEDYKESILYFEKAIQVDNKIPDIYFAKANAEIILNNHEEANLSIKEAINLIKNEDKSSKEIELLKDMLNTDGYKNKEALLVYWYDNNYDNADEGEICEWIKEQLGEEYLEDIEKIENESYNQKVDNAIEKLLSDKGQITAKTDKRKFVYNYSEESYRPKVALQEYIIENGILSYYKKDFNKDGKNELFAAEVENNKIIFRIYELTNNELIPVKSVELVEATGDLIGFAEWTKVFIREHEGIVYAFCEQYSQGGLISDGFSFDIRGYILDENMTEIMNEYDVGSSIGEYLGPINNKLKVYGLSPVLKDYYGYETSVAESSNVTVLANIEQRFNGEHDEVYKNAYGETANPNKITPMDIIIEVNNK